MKAMLLSGLRVVDFTTYVAGPSTGRILGDWGADVIKVEPPGGEPYRKYGDNMGIPCDDKENPLWQSQNGSKRSLVLDLKKPKGMEAMHKLMATADMFISNVRIESLVRLGLDYESLSPKYPKLVWGHMSGFGLYGEEAPRPGYDVTSFWARGGFFADLPPLGSPPFSPPYGAGDNTVALAFAAGMMAGVIKAQKTGRGEKMVTSLYGTAAFVNNQIVISAQFGDKFPKGRYEPGMPLCGPYQCKDGEWLAFNVPAYNQYWKPFCEAVGLEQYIDDSRYNNYANAKQPENYSAMVHVIEDLLLTKDSTYWIPRLVGNGIPFERCQHLLEISSDKQALANRFMVPYKMRSGREFMLPSSPIQFGTLENDMAVDCGVAPLLGENTDEVLLSLGYSQADIDVMVADKAAARYET